MRRAEEERQRAATLGRTSTEGAELERVAADAEAGEVGEAEHDVVLAEGGREGGAASEKLRRNCAIIAPELRTWRKKYSATVIELPSSSSKREVRADFSATPRIRHFRSL